MIGGRPMMSAPPGGGGGQGGQAQVVGEQCLELAGVVILVTGWPRAQPSSRDGPRPIVAMK
jgi:hypothetical protein